nr:hypothetical protein HK105_004791 [Polyrhizophydium stewartii]
MLTAAARWCRYTESPFALLTFVGMLAMVRGNRLVAAMSWSLATAVRANGILAAGFFVWDAVHPFARQHRSMVSEQHAGGRTLRIGHARRGGHDRAVCGLPGTRLAPVLRIGGISSALVLAAAAKHIRLCAGALLVRRAMHVSAADVAAAHADSSAADRDNGFLRYFTPQQAPNFVLAAPIVAISVAGIAHFARQHPAAALTFGLGSPCSAAVLVRLPFVVLWAAMLVLCVTSMNVQVIIRFFTSVPAMFWFLGEAVAAHARGRRLSVPVRAALLYFVLYPLAGAVLFSRFLPPA